MIYYNSERMVERILENFDINENTKRVLKYYINRSGIIEKCNESYGFVYSEIKRIYNKVDNQLDLIYIGKQKILIL